MSENVSLVVVSHSDLVARGTADMVRQMVGNEVVIIPCGGDPAGGLGTNITAITEAIEQAYTDKGVLVIVDLGGAETNSEMAIEMLGEDMRKNIQICDAPIVEGAIMAATEASSGASLEIVRKIAEDINHE